MPADLFAQALNGLAYGVLLFLLSVGLTLIFGMLDVVNLAHGAFYMLGAYAGLSLIAGTGNFWLALLLLLVFGEKLRWFPVGGASDPVLCPVVSSLSCIADRLWHLVLPAATLGLVGAAGTARFQRAAMLEVATQDFVRTARAKGVPERRVVLRHQLRNALLSFITRFGLAFPFLLTGAVLIETIYAWPGMGRLAYESALGRDFPVLQAIVLLLGIVIIVANSLVDAAYAYVDPKLRLTGR